MSQVSGSASHLLNASGLMVDGPCRLLGVSLNVWSYRDAAAVGDQVYSNNGNYLIGKTRVSLRDGSATGDELFSYHIPIGDVSWGCGQTPYTSCSVMDTYGTTRAYTSWHGTVRVQDSQYPRRVKSLSTTRAHSMEPVGQTTFWTVFTVVMGAIGSGMILLTTHAGEPTHGQAAHVNRVSALEVKSERVSVNVENNARILDEVKLEIKELRTEQRQSSQEILRAIEGR